MPVDVSPWELVRQGLPLLHACPSWAGQELERHRRGTRRAARTGTVHVRRGGPYGSRYVSVGRGRAASYELVPEGARVGRQVFDWLATVGR